MDPISLLSLLSTGVSLVTGKSLLGEVVEGVEDLLGVGGGKAQNFGSLLNATQSETTQSSLNVTPQGGISGLMAEGAASLVPANSGEAITDETLQSLNEILGNADSENIDDLAETDATDSGGILGNTKLDDPFGIKAAEANGSPIAVPNPVMPADSNTVVNEDGEVEQATLATQGQAPKTVDGKDIAQQSALANVKVEDKKELFKLGENNASEDLSASINSQTADKLTQSKSDPRPSVFSQSERFADKTNLNQNSNPNQAAFLAHDINRTGGIGDAVRAVRAKEDLKDKLADIDTYKIVNVTKRDNVLDLRLEPAQLGKVQIKFDFTDGKTNIAVYADRPETLDLLQKDTKSIQKILADNGIQSDSNSMSFNLSQQQKQGEHNNFNFFSGKPLSFRVQEEMSKIANNNVNTDGYGNYTDPSYNGMLNIMV